MSSACNKYYRAVKSLCLTDKIYILFSQILAGIISESCIGVLFQILHGEIRIEDNPLDLFFCHSF